MAKKIDKRKKYFMVLDTETCPIDATEKGVNAKNMLVYDIGFCIIDKKGNVYEKGSYVIKDIFVNEPIKMRSAYYYNKLPMYIQELTSGDRILISLKKVRKIIHKTLEKYNTNIVICHNAYFDYTSLNTTIRFLNKGKYFFDYGIEVWDTLKMFYDTIYRQKSYIKFCIENEYLTKHKTPRPQAKAEIIYRYLTDNTNFIENHTGLEDTLIEKDIFVNCLKQHKKMRKKLFEN